MSKIINLDKAIKLRQQGNTFEEISKLLNVSKRWCSTHLKGIKTEKAESIDKLSRKAKSKQGVSKSEIFEELNLSSTDSAEEASKLLNRTVRTIRRKSTEHIVRPDWMLPEHSLFITNMVIANSIALEEKCNEQALEIRHTLLKAIPASKHKEIPSVLKLKNAIMSLSAASVSTRSDSGAKLSNWLESLHKTAVSLEKRNPASIIAETISTSDFEIEEDFIL